MKNGDQSSYNEYPWWNNNDITLTYTTDDEIPDAIINGNGGLNTYHYGRPVNYTGINRLSHEAITSDYNYTKDITIGEVSLQMFIVSRISQWMNNTVQKFFTFRFKEITTNNKRIKSVNERSLAGYIEIENHNIKIAYDEGLFPSELENSVCYDYIANQNVTIGSGSLQTNENGDANFNLYLGVSPHNTPDEMLANRYTKYFKVCTDFYAKHSVNFRPWMTYQTLLSHIIAGQLTDLIHLFVKPTTKTYTNSTWSTSKTWYIKVTFTRNKVSWSDTNGNVVNCETSMLR